MSMRLRWGLVEGRFFMWPPPAVFLVTVAGCAAYPPSSEPRQHASTVDPRHARAPECFLNYHNDLPPMMSVLGQRQAWLAHAPAHTPPLATPPPASRRAVAAAVERAFLGNPDLSIERGTRRAAEWWARSTCTPSGGVCTTRAAVPSNGDRTGVPPVPAARHAKARAEHAVHGSRLVTCRGQRRSHAARPCSACGVWCARNDRMPDDEMR